MSIVREGVKGKVNVLKGNVSRGKVSVIKGNCVKGKVSKRDCAKRKRKCHKRCVCQGESVIKGGVCQRQK